VYFFALTSTRNGYSVWRTDGSAAGTFPLTDPEEQVCRAEFAELNGRSYFAAGDPEHGCELWSSDGTAAGTEVLDVIPGSGGLNPSGLIAAEGQLYFKGFDQHGQELWRSDGTVAGTALVADVAPGGGFGILSDPVALGGRIYFIASDGVNPSTLWSSDGTEAGTGAALPCAFAENCRSIDGLHKVGDRLWLNRTKEFPEVVASLLASDGTPGGTVVLAEAAILSESPPYPFKGKLYFAGSSRNGGTQLWVSDGTAAGTRPFRGRRGAAVFAPESFVQLGERLLFLAFPEQSNQRVLWQTDGAQGSTTVLPAGALGQPVAAAELAGTPARLFFAGGDDASGVELWGVTP
jgi:ELWxxDGT repeat protein